MRFTVTIDTNNEAFTDCDSHEFNAFVEDVFGTSRLGEDA